MEKLNIYCLEEIMSYLILRDKLNLAVTCEQNRQLFVHLAQRYLKAVKCDTINSMTIKEEKALIRFAGNNFQEYQMCDDVLDDLTKYCKKLKRLEWLHSHCLAESHHKIFKLLDFKTLECFTHQKILLKTKVFNNEKSIDASNYMMEILGNTLTKLPKLRSVSLHCAAYKGKYLDALTEVENLQLIDGSNILDEHFTSACENMSNLRILNLTWSSQSCKINVDYQRLLTISPCKNLEKLYLSFAVAGLEVIFDLPKLKYLAIEETNLFNSLQTLAAKKGDSLECLKLINTTVSPGYANHIGKMNALRELMCKLELNQFENLSDLKQLENLF